ncbi:MAG: acyl-CoA dehydrogenase family protein [Phaeodactylibacter sp.]|nr:acyl-CoA dehydrogenase family protein [Phaeodactylibacter sp.]MCB9289116.1 acyl-CoA dehydrogenase family protein [Lewinellaceae bacterium]
MVEAFATPLLKKLYAAVKEFLEAEVYPNELRWLRSPFREVESEIRSLREKAQATGAWNPHLPAGHGGAGLSLSEFGQLGELLGTTPFGHLAFNCQAPDAGNTELLLQHGPPDIKEQFLRPLLAGDIRSCFAMTEPAYAGSNPVRMGTMAVRDGDNYRINGHKWFASSADGASFAIVMAVTNPEAENPYQRASMIIVPTDTPGFQLVRNIPVMGHAGEGWHSHAEIRLEDVRVPRANRLGEEGEGFKLAQQRLGPGRIHHCMRWIGICERAFDMMCRRAATREMGEGRMLGEQQMVQAWIAECRAQIDAARYMVLHTAIKMEKEGQRAASTEISTIKFFVAGVMQKAIDRALQVHGALGVTDDTILSYFYREERGARIYDGPDEAHKASLARRILKGYGLKVKQNQ